jgi:hypothetical protein
MIPPRNQQVSAQIGILEPHTHLMTELLARNDPPTETTNDITAPTGGADAASRG